jgi:TPR repeat protein
MGKEKYRFKQILKAAKKNDAKAQFDLANCYYDGMGLKQNLNKSMYWMETSAKNGYLDAQLYLGNFYLIEQTLNYEKAFYYYSLANSDATAQYILGYFYENGLGVEVDYEKAVYWYEKSADQNHPQAQLALGRMYHEAKGVPEDFSKSAYWLKVAAEQGDRDIQYLLAICYEKGIGVLADSYLSTYWYTKAAEQDHPDSIQKLKLLKKLP